MKKSLIYLPILAFLFAACSGNQPKEHDHNDGTHTHDDGTVHENHDDSAAKQEEFAVPLDTDSINEHKPDDHEHPHKH